MTRTATKTKVREIDLDMASALRKSSNDFRGPTSERVRAAGESFEIGGDQQAGFKYTMQDSPLDRLWSRRAIGGKEYAALKRYREHWYQSGLGGSAQSADLNRIFAANPINMTFLAKSEAQVNHRDNYWAAREHIGHKPGIVVDNVVCQEWDLVIAGHSIGYSSPYRARQKATEILRDAGYRLSKMWGIG